MKTVTLIKDDISLIVDKGINRYVEIHIKKGVVVIKLKTVTGGILSLTFLENSLIKWDIIDYISIEFNSYDAIIDYRLFL